MRPNPVADEVVPPPNVLSLEGTRLKVRQIGKWAEGGERVKALRERSALYAGILKAIVKKNPGDVPGCAAAALEAEKFDLETTLPVGR